MTSLEKKTIFIGIISIITITAAILGYEFLKGNNPFKPNRYFYVVYDNINNLTETAPVLISGKRIGQVKDISFINANSYNKIIVTLFIEENIKIPAGSVAQITTTDLLGTKGIAIIPNSHTNKWAQPGDTLIGAIENSLQEIIMQQLAPLQTTINQLNIILHKINYTLDSASLNDIKATIANINHIVFVLDTMFNPHSRLQTTISDINYISSTLRSQRDTITQIITSTNQILSDINSAHIGQTLTHLDSLISDLNYITTQLKNGKGTLGKIYYSDTLYYKLDSISSKLNDLLQDIKQNPQRYINIKVF